MVVHGGGVVVVDQLLGELFYVEFGGRGDEGDSLPHLISSVR
jgi:hypothetical protein